MSEKRSKLRVVVFSLGWMFVILICTAFVLNIIWKLWFPPFLNQKPVQVSPNIEKMNELVKDIQPKDYVVAYKAASGELMSERFHDWEIPNPKDQVSTCVSCHGDMPHNKDEKTRAFLNMHGMHVACETCHMDAGDTPAPNLFAWYDVETGNIRQKLNIETPLVITHNKLILLTNSELKNYKNDELLREAKALLDKASSLPAVERKKSVEQFHEKKRLTALECRSCHTADFNLYPSFVPYTALGYSEIRARQINNTEVVGMLEKYNSFFLPTFISRQGGM